MSWSRNARCRARSGDRSAYAKLKIDLAPHADAAGYVQAKTEFIQSILDRIAG